MALERLNHGLIVGGLLTPAKELLALEEKLVHQSGEYNQSMTGRVAMFLWLVGISGSVAGNWGGFGIARSVSRSIVELHVPIRAASGKLEEVIGPIDVIPSAGIENLYIILRRMADHVATVVERLQQSQLEVLLQSSWPPWGSCRPDSDQLRNPLTAMKMLLQAAANAGPSAGLNGRDLAVVLAETAKTRTIDPSVSRLCPASAARISG